MYKKITYTCTSFVKENLVFGATVQEIDLLSPNHVLQGHYHTLKCTHKMYQKTGGFVPTSIHVTSQSDTHKHVGGKLDSQFFSLVARWHLRHPAQKIAKLREIAKEKCLSIQEKTLLTCGSKGSGELLASVYNIRAPSNGAHDAPYTSLTRAWDSEQRHLWSQGCVCNRHLMYNCSSRIVKKKFICSLSAISF